MGRHHARDWRARGKIIVLCVGLVISVAASAADELHARVRILVTAFDAPEPDRNGGEVAATAFAGAIGETELAEPVRPSDQPVTWHKWASERWQGELGRLIKESNDPSGIDFSRVGVRTMLAGGLDADYRMEGSILHAQGDGALTLRVTLIDVVGDRQAAVEEARADTQEALATAATTIIQKLEQHWADDALARRVIFILSQGDAIEPDALVPTLRDWMKRWPQSPAPVLALFALAARPQAPMPARDALELAQTLRAMLAAGDASALKLATATGADPYSILADAAVMKGNQTEAMKLHREAAGVMTAKAYEHLIDAAQSGIMARKYADALGAATEALKLRPGNGYANLLYGILLDRTGKRADARNHLQGFLDTHPGDPAEQQIQAQMDLMK